MQTQRVRATNTLVERKSLQLLSNFCAEYSRKTSVLQKYEWKSASAENSYYNDRVHLKWLGEYPWVSAGSWNLQCTILLTAQYSTEKGVPGPNELQPSNQGPHEKLDLSSCDWQQLLRVEQRTEDSYNLVRVTVVSRAGAVRKGNQTHFTSTLCELICRS